MFDFNQDYLRVSKPVTTDGLNLALDKDGKRVMKIVHFPLTAEPYLQRRNQKLPDNLKLIIEKVEAHKMPATPQPNASAEIETLKALLAQSEAEKERLMKDKAATASQQKPAKDETNK